MTAISRSDAPKPKRRVKAFALALLPLALALTACGGGSSDDSTTSPPTDTGDKKPPTDTGDKKPPTDDGDKKSSTDGDDKKSPGTLPDYPSANPDQSAYKAYFNFMRDIANEKIDIYKVTKNNGWSFYNLANMEKLVKLKEIYQNTLANKKPMFDGKEKEEYLKLINLVEGTVIDDYVIELGKIPSILRTKGNRDTTLDFFEDVFETHITTASADEISVNYVRTGGTAGTIGADTSAEQALFFESFRSPKVGGYGPSFGLPDISILSPQSSYTHFVDRANALANTLTAFKTDGNPKAQLSFYHGTSTDNSTTAPIEPHLAIGVDAIHMPHVSLFLYYYAETDKLMSENYMSRDDFMKDLAQNGKEDTWKISGLVDGTGTGTGPGATSRPYFAVIPTSGDVLTYKGYMLAGKINEVATTDTSISTYMGDVRAFLTPGAASTLGIAFTNILPMEKFLAGQTSEDKIVVNSLTLDSTSNPTQFGTTAPGTPAGSNDVNLYGSFYGRLGDFDALRQNAVGVAADVNKNDNNYGYRDAIGGTFNAQLTNADGTDVTTDGDVYYGVFGANAQ